MSADEPGTPGIGGLLRDVLALLLIVAGVVGLNVAAFVANPWVGVAVASTTAITAGVALGAVR